MRDNATQDEVDHVVASLHEAGADAHLSKGEVKTIIGAIGDRDVTCSLELERLPAVEQVVRALKPFEQMRPFASLAGVRFSREG